MAFQKSSLPRDGDGALACVPSFLTWDTKLEQPNIGKEKT
jgi:hypothetical protein